MTVTEGPLEWLALARGTLDRVALKRRDDAWLAAAWADPATRVLVVQDGRTLITHRPEPALVFVAPAQAPDGDRWLLGVGEAGKLGWAGMPGSEPDADPLALPVAPSGVTPTLAEPLTPVPLDFGGVDFAGAVVGEVAGAVGAAAEFGQNLPGLELCVGSFAGCAELGVGAVRDLLGLGLVPALVGVVMWWPAPR